MKLGFGLYRHMLTEDYFRFARQCGATHLIVHLANYYGGGDGRIVTATDEHTNYGECAPLDPVWEEENLRALVKQAASFGLTVEGIENFSPADWYDVLLDGPRRTDGKAQDHRARGGRRGHGVRDGIHARGGRASGRIKRRNRR